MEQEEGKEEEKKVLGGCQKDMNEAGVADHKGHV